MKSLLLMITLFFMTTICHAAIYQYIDKNGVVTYTDTPMENAKQITDVPEGNRDATQSLTQPNHSPPSNAATKSQSPDQAVNKTEPAGYTTFIITSPADQETIQNQPTVPVQITLSPALQKGDTIQMYVDGKPVGDAQNSMQFVLPQLERGTHQLYAVLMDEKKKIIKQSPGITIYVHQAHIGGG